MTPISQGYQNALVSHHNGFLSLEQDIGATITEMDHPPLKLWTQNEQQHHRIDMVFEIVTYMGGNLLELGDVVILALITDLMSDTSQLTQPQLITNLKCDEMAKVLKCVGVITIRELAEKLILPTYRYPVVFHRVLQILNAEDINITQTDHTRH